MQKYSYGHSQPEACRSLKEKSTWALWLLTCSSSLIGAIGDYLSHQLLPFRFEFISEANGIIPILNAN